MISTEAPAIYVKTAAPNARHTHRCWHFNEDTPMREATKQEMKSHPKCQDCPTDAIFPDRKAVTS